MVLTSLILKYIEIIQCRKNNLMGKELMVLEQLDIHTYKSDIGALS